MLKSARKQGRPAKPEKDEEGRMSLGDHLRELRNRLMKAVGAILVVTIASAFFQDEIYDFLIGPFQTYLDSIGCFPGVERVGDKICPILKTDTILSPFTMALKVTLMSGVIIAAPVWLYQLWSFVAPGLHKHEKRYAYGFVVLGAPLFAAGAYVAYLVMPQTYAVMLSFTPDGVDNQISLDGYLDLVTRMVIVFGLGFELPLFLIALNTTGMVSGKRMLGWWRGMIFGLTVFAAFATPSGDPLSMLLLAGPLVVLYFLATAFSLINDKRRQLRNPDAGLSDDQASQIDLDPEDIGEIQPVPAARALPEASAPLRVNGYDDIT